ncbi:MAG: WD40 repeat domain-containing protein [Thermodesulfobacteriota bacterium]
MLLSALRARWYVCFLSGAILSLVPAMGSGLSSMAATGPEQDGLVGTLRQERDIAVSRYLASQSELTLKQDCGLALLLAVEANNTQPTSESAAALYHALHQFPLLCRILHIPRSKVWPGGSVHLSPDRGFMAVREDPRTVAIWDLSRQQLSRRFSVSEIDELVCMGPCAKLIATLGANDRIDIWDVSTGRVVCSVPYTPRKVIPTVNVVGAFSPDGRMFVTRGPRGLSVWSLEKATEAAAIETDGDAGCTAFRPDSRVLAYHDMGRRQIVLWDLNNHRELKALDGVHHRLDHLAFDPSGRHLVAGGPTLDEWDLLDSRPARRRPFGSLVLPELERRRWFGVAFHPTDKVLAVASTKGEKTRILIGSLDRFEIIATFDCPSALATPRIFFAADGKSLLTDGPHDQILVWDVYASRKETHFERQHLPDVHTLAFLPTGKGLITAKPDATIQVRAHPVSKEIAVTTRGRRHIERMVVSPDGRLVAAATKEGAGGLSRIKSLLIVDIQSGKTISEYACPKDSRELTGLAFTASNDVVALLSIEERPPDKSYLPSVGGALHGSCLLQWTRTLGKWAIDKFIEGKRAPSVAALSPDGLQVAETALYGDLTTRLRSVAAPHTVVRALTRKDRSPEFGTRSDKTEFLAFSSDGSILACVTTGAGVRQVGSEIWLHSWETSTGKEVAPPVSLNPGDQMKLALSPNGLVLAQGGIVGCHGELWLWRMPAWSPIGCLDVSPPCMSDGSCTEDERTGVEFLDQVFFSPDGKALAARVVRHSPDIDAFEKERTDMYLWDTDINSWKAQACAIANRNLSTAEWKRYLGHRAYCKTCPDLPHGESREVDHNSRERQGK